MTDTERHILIIVVVKLLKLFHSGEDKFTHVHIDTDWKIDLNYAEKIGLGTPNYNLIIVN